MTVRTWLEIAAFCSLVVADAYGWVPVSQTLFQLPLIWLLLRLRHESWASIGFSRPSLLPACVLAGVIAGIAFELLAVFVTTPLISNLVGAEPDYSALKDIQGNFGLLMLFLALSWSLAAFGEEICFRGFLMRRLVQVLGDSRPAWVASLLASSVLFGWGHTEQGVSGWIQEGLSGFLLGVLFLASGRNLTVPIVAHGVSNTLAFVLIYYGHYPGLGVA